MKILYATLEHVFLYFPLIAGISISYKVLKRTDITVDGSFVLGAAVYAKALSLGINLPTSFLLAISFGALAGISVIVIEKFIQIDSLVAGILMLFMLQSINFILMGRPNISINNNNNIDINYLIIIYTIILFIILALILQSNYGLMFRAAGSNPEIFTNQLGKNVFFYRLKGIALSNALAASTGALVAQFSGYADLNMGFGVTIVGIGSVVIGANLYNNFLKTNKFNGFKLLFAGICGCFAYFFIMHLLLMLGINPIYLKLFLGLILIFCLRRNVLCNKA